jgi:hypothetical protein
MASILHKYVTGRLVEPAVSFNPDRSQSGSRLAVGGFIPTLFC